VKTWFQAFAFSNATLYRYITAVRSTGAPPALRAAPVAAALPLPPQLHDATLTADAEGAQVGLYSTRPS
jgi:hypothetical protein